MEFNPVALDIVWTLFATVLVFLMQAGFALLESGATRAKNSINIIMKNVMDMSLGSLAFWMVGFGLMFGTNDSGWIGTSNFFLSDIDPASESGYFDFAFFIFQTVFAATAATIISGAVAERTKFLAYIIYAVAVTGFIYPVFGSWVWGGGWLNDVGPGFVDFAGSTVVHSVGGWAALAGAIVIGPRIGKYVDGKAVRIPGHSVTLMALGVFILWFGWFGFNAGSEVMVDGITVSAWTVTNTATGMATVTWVLMSWAHTGKPSIVGAATGAVAGLVAITPASGWVGPMAAIIIGIAAGTVCYGCVAFKNARKWDDALDVWGVHGMGGLTGAILTGTLASPHIWDTGDGIGAWTGTPEGYEQQAISIVAAGMSIAYAFGVSIVIFKVMDAVWPGGIRVTPKEEEIGLDLSQNGERAYVNE